MTLKKAARGHISASNNSEGENQGLVNSGNTNHEMCMICVRASARMDRQGRLGG